MTFIIIFLWSSKEVLFYAVTKLRFPLLVTSWTKTGVARCITWISKENSSRENTFQGSVWVLSTRIPLIGTSQCPNSGWMGERGIFHSQWWKWSDEFCNLCYQEILQRMQNKVFWSQFALLVVFLLRHNLLKGHDKYIIWNNKITSLT